MTKRRGGAVCSDVPQSDLSGRVHTIRSNSLRPLHSDSHTHTHTHTQTDRHSRRITNYCDDDDDDDDDSGFLLQKRIDYCLMARSTRSITLHIPAGWTSDVAPMGRNDMLPLMAISVLSVVTDWTMPRQIIDSVDDLLSCFEIITDLFRLVFEILVDRWVPLPRWGYLLV